MGFESVLFVYETKIVNFYDHCKIQIYTRGEFHKKKNQKLLLHISWAKILKLTINNSIVSRFLLCFHYFDFVFLKKKNYK